MNTILVMLVITAVMFTIERLWPANDLPKTEKWWPRVILTNGCQVAIVLLLGSGWDQWVAANTVIAPWSLRHHVPFPVQVLVGYIAITFVYYWWHRIRHDSAFFWRFCHQLHHSPRRMEVLMSFYKHPVEITINGLLTSIIVFPIVGCSVEAAALITLATGVAELFYHWNIRTPRWLGPFFQRPESHRIHHQRNHHTNNYSDIPLWDILFGTYQNPSAPITECGFDSDKEDRIDDILAFRDVHTATNQKLAPLHLLPSCIGCSKRWACHQSRQTANKQTNENSITD